jgi:hypothetical protein
MSVLPASCEGIIPEASTDPERMILCLQYRHGPGRLRTLLDCLFGVFES